MSQREEGVEEVAESAQTASNEATERLYYEKTQLQKVFEAVSEGNWTAEIVEWVKAAFFNPQERQSWEMAVWALETCPSPEVLMWIETFVVGDYSLQDRSDALLVAAHIPGYPSLGLLQRLLYSSDEAIRLVAAQCMVWRGGWDAQAKAYSEILLAMPEYEHLRSTQGRDVSGDAYNARGISVPQS